MASFFDARIGDQVVPDVRGLGFEDARSRASSARVTLVNPDLDGPPLAALRWRKDLVALRQDPEPGTHVALHASIRVWLGASVDGASMPVRRSAPPAFGEGVSDDRGAPPEG